MTIPYLHPVVVHFPIALLLVGALTSVVWLATGRAFWRQATLGLVLLGAVGAVVAKQSGEQIEEGLEGRPGFNEALVHEHEERAEQTVILGLLALGALGFAEVRARRRRLDEAARTTGDPLAMRAVATALTLGAAALVGVTGHLGGQMTWGVPSGQVAPGANAGERGEAGERSEAAPTAAPANPTAAPANVASPAAPVSRDVDGDGD